MSGSRIVGAALAALLAALLAGTPAAAGAASDPSQSLEVRCLAVFLTMAGEEDEDTKSAGVMGSLYFAGLVEGQNPGSDPLDLVVESLKHGTPDDAAVALCGERLKALGDHWIKRGQELQQAAEAGEGSL